MTPATALATVIANITTNGRGEITGAVMRSVLDAIIALDDNAGAIKSPVKAATTANITLSGAQTIDGVSIVAGDRVLVKDQTTGADNGIYVAASGAWARGIDFDANATVLEGSLVFVMEGSTQAKSGWLQTAVAPVIGTTALVFEQFSGGGGGGDNYDIGFFMEAPASTGEIVGRYVTPRAFRIPTGATGSEATADAPATADATMTLAKNGTPFGTVTFATGAGVGTFSVASVTTFGVGDVLTLVAPTPQDASLASVAVTLTGTLI